MAKWADYLISQVSYDQNHIITKVKQHRDNGNTVDKGEIVDRHIIANNLGHGNRYMTIYGDLGKIRMGKNVRYFRAYEHHYIRIDNNKVSSDNLGDLPQPDESKQEEKPVLTETKPKPVVETKPLSALSSAFFAEQVEEPEPAKVEAEVTPEPVEVEAEVTPEPAKKKAQKTKSSTKKTKKKITKKTKKKTKKKTTVKKKITKKTKKKTTVKKKIRKKTTK